MTDAPTHLEPIWTDRGFKIMPKLQIGIEVVQVLESSCATIPHIWLVIGGRHGDEDRSAAHLTLEDAAKLRDQLDYLINNHYQLEGEREEER